MSTQFKCQKHFYFKLFSLFNIIITNQFSVSTVSMLKTVQFQTIQFSINTQLKCKYYLIVKNISISSNSVCQVVVIETVQFSLMKNLVYTVKFQKSTMLNKGSYTVNLKEMVMEKIPFIPKIWSLTTRCSRVSYLFLSLNP